MQIIHKLKDILFMARDFIKIMSGKSYFHQPDHLGKFFQDKRSYYIDFRGKVNWQGDFNENVPVLYFPSIDRTVFFPSTIIQYGLGSIDKYFETNDTTYLINVNSVYDWIKKNINQEFYLDNKLIELYESNIYYSNNSAMTQGTALSFLIRVLKFNLIVGDYNEVRMLIKNIYKNMLMPTNMNGTALYMHNDIYLCEYCRPDNYLVMNGSVFAIFGLYDYNFMFEEKESYLEKILNTFEKNAPNYIMADNWSYYDNKMRLSSPIYQYTHINLLEALYRLTHRETFNLMAIKLKAGYTLKNRVKYTIFKIIDKLKDNLPYSTVK